MRMNHLTVLVARDWKRLQTRRVLERVEGLVRGLFGYQEHLQGYEKKVQGHFTQCTFKAHNLLNAGLVPTPQIIISRDPQTFVGI